MRFWLKTYKRGGDFVVAICDEEIMGKEFREGNRRLKIGSFYKGRLVDREEALSVLKEATIINASGKGTMKLLKELGYEVERSAIYIDGVPHLQIVYYFM